MNHYIDALQEQYPTDLILLAVGAALKHYRILANYSSAEAGRIVGTTGRTVQYMEATNPTKMKERGGSLRFILELTKLYGVDIRTFFDTVEKILSNRLTPKTRKTRTNVLRN